MDEWPRKRTRDEKNGSHSSENMVAYVNVCIEKALGWGVGKKSPLAGVKKAARQAQMP